MANFPISCIGIIERDNEILLVEEDKAGSEGEWALPGGGLEQNENLEDCVVREIQEETGLDAEIEKPLGIYVLNLSDTKMFVHVFICSLIDENISISHDESVRRAEFVEKEDIDNLELRFSELKEILDDYWNDVEFEIRKI